MPASKRTVSFRLSKDVVSAIDDKCERTGLTKTSIVDEALRRFLELPECDRGPTMHERLTRLEQRVAELEGGSKINDVDRVANSTIGSADSSPN